MLITLHERMRREERIENVNNTAYSEFAKNLYKKTKFIKPIALLGILLLPYVIRPRWCFFEFKNLDD